MLSEDMKIPLLRYRTGDYGRIFEYDEIVQILARHGHTVAPDLKLPFVAVYGRGTSISSDTGELNPDEIKEAIYADHTIASLVTGNFRMSISAEKLIQLDLQLRKGKTPPRDATDRLLGNLADINPTKAKAVFIPYQSFPHRMEVDWERKFRYI